MEKSKYLWPLFRDDADTFRFMMAMSPWERKIRALNACSIAVTKAMKLAKDPFGVIKRALKRFLKSNRKVK